MEIKNIRYVISVKNSEFYVHVNGVSKGNLTDKIEESALFHNEEDACAIANKLNKESNFEVFLAELVECTYNISD